MFRNSNEFKSDKILLYCFAADLLDVVLLELRDDCFLGQVWLVATYRNEDERCKEKIK